MTDRASGFASPPDGMDVELGHDGVLWTVGARSGAAGLAVTALALGVGGVGLGLWSSSWVAAVALVPLALGAALAGQALRRTRVRVSDRAIVIEERGPAGTEVTRIPLDELADLRIHVQDDEPRLLLRTRGSVVVVGTGRPREQLDWILAAVDVAQEAFARRERAEGREWRFLRKVPDGLDRLRE